MGFIAQFNANWADEMDVFGLRYFESMDQYLKDFCWTAAFDYIGVDVADMAEFLGLAVNPDERFFNYEDPIKEYFFAHPHEMQERYYKMTEDESFSDIDNIYVNFIYVAILMRMEDNPNYNPWSEDEETSICVGTNEYIYMNVGDYLSYINPDIFAEGDIADQLTHSNKFYQRGPFYM